MVTLGLNISIHTYTNLHRQVYSLKVDNFIVVVVLVVQDCEYLKYNLFTNFFDVDFIFLTTAAAPLFKNWVS